jgi:hypothetical protein
MARYFCARVICDVEYSTDENEDGREQACVIVTCGECGHKEQSWGDGERSVNRCLALLRENCPQGETNFYKVEE